VDYFDPSNGEWNNHVDLGEWPDLFLIAPATANSLFKMAHGAADNLLLATYLSARCPVFFAPAMDLEMYQHPTTKKNISTLLSYGHQLVAPGTGELASGLEGEGRMAEPETIVETLNAHFQRDLPFTGKHFLINAGPTYEPIDPVRFIGNRSSGKMGYALAHEVVARGGRVTLVSGPVSLTAPEGVELIKVETASEMFDACVAHSEDYDIAIFSAAVADYTVKNTADQKIKKSTAAMALELQPTRDILKHFGEKKRKDQLLVGFALETENEEEYARNKRDAKNLDLIVLNSLNDEGAGFGGNTNKITLLRRDNKISRFQLKDKDAVAQDILNELNELIANSSND
jgi:phosphopantothenoylcysteine decarboxylase/phosphopantothenate--cysteine ligase